MSGIHQMFLTGNAAATVAVLWNSADKAANIVLSGGDLVAGRNGTNTYQSVRATKSWASGNHYYEVLVSGSNATSMMCGFAKSTTSLNSFVGSDTASHGYNQNGSTYTNSSQNSSGASSFSPGDVLMFAYNATSGGIWFGKNGTWLFSGDPATGASPRASFTPGDTVFPMCSIFEAGASQTFTARFKTSAFSYSVPSGFSPWET